VARRAFAPLNEGLPRLLPVLALTLLPEAVSAVCLAVLRKRLRLHSTVFPEIAASVASLLVGIFLAAVGLGVWSLMGAYLTGSVAKAVLLWRRTHDLTPLSPTLAHTGPLLRGSIYFFLLAAMGLLLVDLDKAILGLFLSAQDLGYYVMAFSLVYLPCRVVEGPLRQVAYPAFVAARSHPAELQEIYRRFTLVCLALELPASLFLASNADLVVLALYGPRWASIVPLVAWMSFLPLADPFSKFGNNLLQAVGKESLQYYASIPYLAFFVVAGYMLAGRFGVAGMIVANYLQVGGWAITGCFFRAMGGGRRILRDVATLYAITIGVFGAAWLLAGASPWGFRTVSVVLLAALWSAFLLYALHGRAPGAWPDAIRSLLVRGGRP
jgi:O-antigen/teichoic acid export membrane protein